MVREAAGIALGLLSLHYWPTLPPYSVVMIAVVTGSLVSAYLRERLLICIVFGVVLANYSAVAYLDDVETVAAERGDITIIGEVRSLINHNIPNTLFEIVTIDDSSAGGSLPAGLRLHLRWGSGTFAGDTQLPMPDIKLGEHWQFTLRLKPPYGRVNSAGYDRERDAVGKGIHGIGVILDAVRLDTPIGWHDHLRQTMYQHAIAMTRDLPFGAYLLALGFGERTALTDQDWQLLRDSGLAHLMAISGLHIGLAVVIGWRLGGMLRGGAINLYYLTWLPLWCGLLLGGGYAWLAGFTVPTIRALLMSVVILLLMRLRIGWPRWQVLLVAFAACLMINPLASYTAGFWLSFTAVAIIMFAGVGGVGRQEQPSAVNHGWQSLLFSIWGAVRQLFVMQLALLLLMLPVQWLWFGGFAWLAPLVNLLAVPWVSLLTVPMVLLAVGLSWWPALSGLGWWAADLSLKPVMWLAGLAQGAWLPLTGDMAGGLLGLAVLACLIWLLPVRRYAALLVSGGLIVLALMPFDGPTSGSGEREVEEGPARVFIDMLDVGHGLAVLISTSQGAVLYDTGNAWPGGSIASAVIEPVLRQRGHERLDGLILSHGDSDHAGGAEYLVRHFSPSWMRSSDYRDGFSSCVRGETWLWQGLEFRALWPPKRVRRAANPHSCVIALGYANAPPFMLLTGDIDAISELLLARLEPDLTPEILTVPHHGSLTSSSLTWLTAMRPEVALVSAARFNPWRLPNPEVRRRYVAMGSQWLSTADHGQISITRVGNEMEIVRYRQDIRPGWFRPRPSRVGDNPKTD